MKLKYRPAAIADIQRACDYISGVLKNPRAAASLKSQILSEALSLKWHPYKGIPLESKYDGLETKIRILIVAKQLIFYEVHDDLIEVIRVLDGRTDYLALLFGAEAPQEQETG